MRHGVAVQLGGTAGEGLESGGESLAKALTQLGFRPSTQRDFPSRIRGGDTTFTVRLTADGWLAPPPVIDLALAFNETVLPRMDAQLGPGSLLLLDEGVAFVATSGAEVASMPFSALAKQAGLPKAKNVVALGATAAILGIDVDALGAAVTARFARKGAEVVAANKEALRLGFAAATQFAGRFMAPKADGVVRHWMSGNQAAALGALAAGCRYAAAYPITPASDVLEYLTPRLQELGGVALQMEDEMAALNACIGAGFAGARALTATSGPGISLMTETMGLAGSTETPVVVLDCQRPGPSTGMPTKHAQDDIWHLCLGGHGEDVRVVLAPMDVADAFLMTSEAFRLAWKFRAPAFVALDQQCSLMKQAVDTFDVAAEAAKHGREPVAYDGDAWSGAWEPYGSDPVTIPGEPGPWLSNSTEHGPNGFTTELPAVRSAMMERRRGIMRQIVDDADGPVFVEGDGDTVVVTCGSTTGAVREACQGKARVLSIRLLWPFPTEAVAAAIGERRVVVAEANAFGQLEALLKMHLPVHDRLTPCRSDNGNPVSAAEVTACL